MSPPQSMVNAAIAIVLTDIIGSTKFVQKHGAATAATWFGMHDRMILSLITRYNGQWVDNSDGHLMYFASTSDAVAFAFEYKKKLRVHKFPFRSRVGIHWDEDMIITHAAQHLVAGGVKRINIEGLGKARAARCMSICGPEQILLTYPAMMNFKARMTRNPNIPKKAQSALVGLYQFKGVSEPERIYAMGLIEEQLQPPGDGEKVKRLGGKKRIRTHLRNKTLKEKFWYFYWRVGFIAACWWIYMLWPLLSNDAMQRSWNLDYMIFTPFEWIQYFFDMIVEAFHFVYKDIQK